MLITAAWPTYDATLKDAAAEEQIGVVQEMTRAIRDVRNQHAVAPSKVLEVTIKPTSAELKGVIEVSRGIIEPLANAQLVAVEMNVAKPADAATAVLANAEVYVAGVVDKDAEKKKLSKRCEDLQKFIASNKAKLGNEAFVGKAPAKVVQGLRDQLAQQESELAAVEKNLREMGA